MLNILRRNAQSVVVQSLVVIIAVVFIFWGVGTNMRDNPNALAVVNGKEIPYRDFQQNYERTIEGYKQQFGGQLPQGLLEKLGLKEQVLDQLIQAELLRQGAEKSGIQISKEAVQRAIQEMPVFISDGRFNLAQYKTVLERNRLSPANFEAGIHSDLLSKRMIGALASFAVTPAQEAQQWLAYIDQEIKLLHGVVKSEDYIAKVKVDNEALAAWYETVKQNYKTAAQSKLQYLSFLFEDDLKQVAVSDEAVRTYFREHAETYNTPEKRRARHILLMVSEQDGADAKTTKRAEAERILEQIKKGGDFAKLAAQFSEDTTKTKGGDLGFFGRGQMVQPFEDSVFGLKKGEISGVVETPFGFHLIKLEEVVSAKTQTLEEVSGSIRKTLERQGVKAITFKKASSAYEEVIRAGSMAKYSSGPGGHPVLRTDFFSRSAPPKGVMSADEAFLQAAFSLRKGELSSIVETASGYAILFVEDVREAVAPELDAVRERIATDYRKEKSIDLARAAANELLKKMREQQTWPAELQRSESGYLKRSGSAGVVPEEVRQDAFSRAGRERFPDTVIATGTSFNLYQIIDSRQGKEELDANQKRALEQQLLDSGRGVLTVDWIARLRKEAKITINNRMLQ